jgi:hypothetical protein
MAEELPWVLHFVPAVRPANLHQILRLTPNFEASISGEYLPVFTTEKLAEDFADAFGRSIGLVLEPARPVASSAALDAIQYLHLHEVTHVCIDPDAAGRSCTNLVPVAEYYDRFRDRSG